MRVLDLFSGIGGFSLGLERAGMQTVAFCEYDKHAQLVLKKHWPNVPIFDDVRTLDGKQFNGKVDVVCGGFPCQPFSVAGKQKGKSDERHLWPEMLRIITECQPTWVIGENVSGFVNMALDDCWSDLEAAGYEVQPFVIPACGVGAYHRRERVWIVGYTKHNGSPSAEISGIINKTSNNNSQRSNEAGEFAGASRSGSGEVMADPIGKRRCGGDTERQYAGYVGEPSRDSRENTGGVESRDIESRLGGAPDGLPDWLDGFEYAGDPDRYGTPRVTTRKEGRATRLKQLGNSVQPQIPEIIGRAIVSSATEYKI